MARLCGRLGSGLTAWRGVAAPGFVFPREISSALWSEERMDPSERLYQLCQRLRNEGNVVKIGGDYVRWDLEVFGGMFGSARLLMAVEDHGAGAQYVRTRISPRSRIGAGIVLIFFGALTLIALLAREWEVASIFATFWLLLASRTFQQAGQATAAILRVVPIAAPPQPQRMETAQVTFSS